MLYQVHIGKNVLIAENCSIGKCSIGDQTVIGRGCVIEDGVKIGRRVTVAPGCVIGQGAVVENGAALEEGVIVSAKARVGAQKKIPVGTIVKRRGK